MGMFSPLRGTLPFCRVSVGVVSAMSAVLPAYLSFKGLW
jgi:hypothetical protein